MYKQNFFMCVCFFFVSLGYGTGEAKKHLFELNRVFSPLSTQDEVYMEVDPVLQSALEGHRVVSDLYF